MDDSKIESTTGEGSEILGEAEIIKVPSDGNPDDDSTAGEGFNSMTPEEQQELLQHIQSSMARSQFFQSKHHRARELRLYHRHFSPKARKRKKDRRKVTRASRQQNYRFAKSR